MTAAAEAMMSTMPLAAGELKMQMALLTSSFYFCLGFLTHSLLYSKNRPSLIYNRWLSEDKPAELR